MFFIKLRLTESNLGPSKRNHFKAAALSARLLPLKNLFIFLYNILIQKSNIKLAYFKCIYLSIEGKLVFYYFLKVVMNKHLMFYPKFLYKAKLH